MYINLYINIKEMNQNQNQKQLHTKAPLLKIVTIGDSGVGKTTLIQSFIVSIDLILFFNQIIVKW